MKKYVAILLVLVMCFVLAACGEGEQSEVPEQSANGTFSAADLLLTNGGREYKCGGYIENMTSYFGDGYAYSEAMSCAYDGMDKVFGYESKGVDFSTRPDGSKDIVCEIYTYSAGWETSKGIGMSATRQQVKDAYGEPTQSTNFMYYYILPPSNADSEGASLYFEFADGDTVSGVGITAEQLIGED